MSKNSDRLNARFLVNMQRIGQLTNLAVSDVFVDAPKPKVFGNYEGLSADIFRSIVVFLHATFEDVLRSHLHNPNHKITFSSGSDITKALQRSSINVAPFKRLYPPLTQMAKRRIRIVHHADLPSRDATVVDPWAFADYWQLTQWNLAVLAFYYQLLVSTHAADDVQLLMNERMTAAMTAHVDFANQCLAFTTIPRDDKTHWLNKATDWLSQTSDTLDKIKKLLSVTVEDVLGQPHLRLPNVSKEDQN